MTPTAAFGAPNRFKLLEGTRSYDRCIQPTLGDEEGIWRC